MTHTQCRYGAVVSVCQSDAGTGRRGLERQFERDLGRDGHHRRRTADLFHRYQYGEYDLVGPGLSDSIARQQTQSMAELRAARAAACDVAAGNRGHRDRSASVLGRAADDRAADNDRRRCECRPRCRTSATPSDSAPTSDRNCRRTSRCWPNMADCQRFRWCPMSLNRPRFKIMLYKTVGVRTPARGAEVRGRVLDPAGRPVSGHASSSGPTRQTPTGTAPISFAQFLRVSTS